MRKQILFLTLYTMLGVLFTACSKDYLDKKPDKALVVPTTLADFQAVLDHVVVMNATVGLTNIACDDFFKPDANLSAMTQLELNTYFWHQEMFDKPSGNDWEVPYKAVFYANVVLDGLAMLERTSYNQIEWDRIKGSALFFRSIAFFHLSQSFAPPYDPLKASELLGIPLPLSSNVNTILGRGSLQQTYNQMILDLNNAFPLLPDKPKSTNRASKCAVYGYLSRIYLIMGDFEKAAKFASDYLQISNSLIDFNTLNATAARPLPNGGTPNANVEVLFAMFLNAYAYDPSTSTFIVPEVYDTYETDDLRKTCFFASRPGGNYTFKGSYFGSTSSFGGIATNEIYLIRAECLARLGQTQKALDDLNVLLITRWRKNAAGNNTYIERKSANPREALKIILKERRKELIGRGLRWSDLRRLNREADLAITLSRTSNGITYTILPNSNLYTFPIPLNEILASGIEQNIR